MEWSPSVCGSRAVDPRFFICLLRIFQVCKDLGPVAIFCSVKEVGTLFVVCTIRRGWEVVCKPNGRRRCGCHREVFVAYMVG